MDRETAMRKIKKCLALSESQEPNEAASALRQAQALMEKFSIDHPELLIMDVNEQWAKSRATKTPPAYEAFLAELVAAGFGCKLLFCRKWQAGKIEGAYIFVGSGASAEVAQYTFTVLARKLMQARALYTKEKLTRYRRNKVAAADLFCNGWVHAISLLVDAANVSNGQSLAIDTYLTFHHPKSGGNETRARKRSLADENKVRDHRVNGWLAGKTVTVRDGLAAKGKAIPLEFEYRNEESNT